MQFNSYWYMIPMYQYCLYWYRQINISIYIVVILIQIILRYQYMDINTYWYRVFTGNFIVIYWYSVFSHIIIVHIDVLLQNISKGHILIWSLLNTGCSQCKYRYSSSRWQSAPLPLLPLHSRSQIVTSLWPPTYILSVATLCSILHLSVTMVTCLV